MLTKKQLDVFKVFRNNLMRKITFSELKKELKENSSSKLQRTISLFKEEDLVNVEVIGKSKLIFLNFENNKLFDYLSIFEREFYENMPYEVLKNIQNEILKETEFFSFIVFGSYASKKATKKSDLDLCVLVENEDVKKEIVPLINSVKRKEVLEVYVEIFTRSEFLEMLGDEKENVGKEIVRNHFVFYGLGNFYKLILKRYGNVVD